MGEVQGAARRRLRGQEEPPVLRAPGLPAHGEEGPAAGPVRLPRPLLGIDLGGREAEFPGLGVARLGAVSARADAAEEHAAAGVLTFGVPLTAAYTPTTVTCVIL